MTCLRTNIRLHTDFSFITDSSCLQEYTVQDPMPSIVCKYANSLKHFDCHVGRCMTGHGGHRLPERFNFIQL